MPLRLSPSPSPTPAPRELPSRSHFTSLHSDPSLDPLPHSMNPRAKRWLAWATPERRKYTPLFLLRAYALDWLVSIVLAVLFWYLGEIKGFRRHFSLTDTSIQYPFTVHERIPNLGLVLICGVAPAVLIPVVSLLTPARGIADIHAGLLGLIVSLAIAGSVTNVVKVVVGRPRPDLISRCQPSPGSANSPVFGLVTDAICTSTAEKIMNDGFRSFPSGHSSLSFAGLSFLTFFIAGKLHLWDQVGSGIKAWITVVPMNGAALVAISRTMDYRHHATDVLSGSILGIAVAYFSYRQYYPPLDSPTAHLCYPPLRRFSDNLPLVGSSAARAEREYRDDEEAGMGLARAGSDHEDRRESVEMTPPVPRVGTSNSAITKPADVLPTQA